ncbi:MAG: ATP-binding cassette domain-containing protein [Cyanobacteria bacterium REEB459]|nr:ATP-binding cassette domain-containing protein [Cyanobacteria bacterium REEB459]
MALFTLRSLQKDFGIKEILRDASFSLDAGERVGVIGTNGSGKSTLLKMLAGLEPWDAGELWVNPGARVVYLPQQPEFNHNCTVLEQVFKDAGPAMDLIRQYEAVSHQLAQHPGDSAQLLVQLSQLTDQITSADAWDLETRAKVILTRLGIADFDARVQDLSGGYRKRVAIAAALMADPEALLMDEPTNHLDAESVEWLQGYLSNFSGALLLITHDRYFLDQVTNRILEIDRGDLFSYDGNYAYYLEKKAAAEAADQSRQRKHAGVLRRELEWLKRGAKARSTKQKARIDRIGEMQNRQFKQTQAQVDISTAGRRIGKKVVDLEGVSKVYGDRLLIDNFSYGFTPEDRVGIIGPNGVGKSTLMNVITGRLQPDQGTVEIGSTIHIGYFDQHSEDLTAHPDQRAIEYLKQTAEMVTTADGSVITASQMLERFLFTPNQQYAPLHKLSGGERRRLFLLRVLMEAPNLLILDEPTNDLDIQTLGVLEEYLEHFNGCVIVVSHDRYFLDRTVQTIFAFEGEGRLRQYPGNYSLYLDYRQAEAAAAKAKQPVPTPTHSRSEAKKSGPAAGADQPRPLSFKEKQEYHQLEGQIEALEAEKHQVEAQLYGQTGQDYTAVAQLSEQLASLSDRLDQAMERWVNLADRLNA